MAALLIALNFIVFAAMRERGLSSMASRSFGLLFIESVVVAVLCRPENSVVATRHPPICLAFPSGRWPAGDCGGLFIRRYLQTHKPIEPGFVWSATAVSCGCKSRQSGRLDATSPLLL